MDRCDVVVLVIDATEGVTDQDAAIAGYAENRGRAIVIAANKWDLMKGEEKAFEKFEERVRMKLKFLDFAPVLAVAPAAAAFEQPPLAQPLLEQPPVVALAEAVAARNSFILPSSCVATAWA